MYGVGVRHWFVGLTAVVVVCGGTAACAVRHSTHATIDVDAAVALADQPVHVRVSGLRAREAVTIASQAADAQGQRWRGEATFAANGDGVVDIDRSAPVSGSYGGAAGNCRVPGLPESLRDIPLEYFVTAARFLRAQPGADPGGVVVNGYSRGSEAALLLAESYPDLVRGAILYAPNDSVGSSFPGGGNAWTNGGVPVPQTTIPVTHVAGMVLAIAGGEDRFWRSAAQAQRIMQR